MKDIYILEHIIEQEDSEEIKFIGVFSSIIEAKTAISFLKNKKGFVDYPIDYFQISKETINNYGWKEGFIKWEDSFD